MSGKDYLVKISDDGTSMGNMVEVEFQGDLTINEGRTVERENYKNGSKTAQGDDGWSAEFNMSLAAPIPTGIAEVLAASDNDENAYILIEGSVTGSRTWAGPVKCIVTQINLPTSGEEECTVNLSENGTIVIGTKGP